jgi:hypothetical protein
MSSLAAITGRDVKRASGLIATASPAAIGIILLLNRIFEVFPATGTPAGAALQRLGDVPARRSRSLESDTADAQHLVPAMPNPEPDILGAELVEGEANPVMRPAEYKPSEPDNMVQRSDGVYVGLNEAWEQGRSLDRVTQGPAL